MQSSSQIISTNNQHPTFYRPDALQSPNSVKVLKGKTFHGLAYPMLAWALPTLSLTTSSSWLPWGGLPCLSSALRCQYPNSMIWLFNTVISYCRHVDMCQCLHDVNGLCMQVSKCIRQNILERLLMSNLSMNDSSSYMYSLCWTSTQNWSQHTSQYTGILGN